MRMCSSVLALGCLLTILLTLTLSDARLVAIPKLGPCSTTVPGPPIYVSKLADLSKRLSFSNRTTVLLYLSANLTLSAPLLFGSAWSCTIIKADPALGPSQRPFFYMPTDKAPTAIIVGATNIIFMGVGFKQDYNSSISPWCPYTDLTRKYEMYPDWICPSVFVYRSFNVLISKARIYGRTDVFRSGNVEISYSYLEADYPGNQPAGGGKSSCTIRFQLCGDPVNLVRANNKLANNEIVGHASTVLISWSTVGITVMNNYIHWFRFAGIQCGDGMVNVADCMLNSIELNYIKSDRPADIDKDGAGIYYDLHWFNPGNRDSCNYIINPPHCYYLDYTTSGALIDGMVCLYPRDGFKINTGKLNHVSSAVIVNAFGGAAFISCQNWCDNRCGGNSEGQAWWSQKQKSFNNSLWATNFPYLQNYCAETQYDGISCAPFPAVQFTSAVAAGAALPHCYENLVGPDAKNRFLSPNFTLMGNCSGIPMKNDIEIIYVDNRLSLSNFWASAWIPYYSSCEMLPAVMQSNKMVSSTQKWFNGTLGFNDDLHMTDLGVDDPSAPMYQNYPDFYSCPRRLVGPQNSAFAKARSDGSVMAKFNRYTPRWWHDTYSIVPKSDGTRPVKRKRPLRK